MPVRIILFTRRWPALALALASMPALAHAVPPDYGHDFVTIGAPGNRGATPTEAPMWRADLHGPLGAVDDIYRITRTEVTNAQYFEFVSVYTRTPGFTGGRGMLGSGMFIDDFDPHGFPIVRMFEGVEQHAADPSFQFAARYANWLHNGKGNRLEDFETGVYDTSTFGIDPVTGQRTDQIARSPGATFFIPTIHEWAKAAYFDPNRYGPGEGGYWAYPDGGDEPLVGGPPGEPGAETSAGIGFEYPQYQQLDVGLYPHATSPWGLLDASGGEEEVFETIANARRFRFGSGTNTSALDLALQDHLDWNFEVPPENSIGFRIASVVPAPGVLAVLLAGSFMTQFRRRNPCLEC